MITQSRRFWRCLFRVKGVWNCVVSVAFFFGEDALRAWLHAPPTDPVYRALFLGLAFAFGLGYWWTGRDPEKNRNIVRMAVFGQLSVFVISVYAVEFAPQRLPWPFIAPGVVDLLFAIAFVVFLVRHPSPALHGSDS